MKIHFPRLILFLFSLLIVGLSACSGSVPAAELPLAEGRPTFLFFFTDN